MSFSAGWRPELSNWTFVGVGSSRARADVGLADDPRNRLSPVPAVRPARARAPVRARGPAAPPDRGWRGAAIAIQIGIVSIFPGDLGPLGEPLHILSYLFLGAFAWANRRIAGLPIIALGGLLNFICITVNGGVMPADPDALAAIGRSPTSDEFINSTALATPQARVPRRHHPDAGLVARQQRLQRRRPADPDGRLRAPARGLRVAARPAALPARRRWRWPEPVLRAALADAQQPALLRRPRAVVPRIGPRVRRAAAARVRPLRLRMGGRGGAAARPAAGGRARAAGRRARGPLGLAHVRAARRRHPLPRLPACCCSAASLGLMIGGAALAGVGTALFAPAALAGLPQLAPGDRRAGGDGPVRRARRPRAHARPGAGRRAAARAVDRRPAGAQRGLVRASAAC